MGYVYILQSLVNGRFYIGSTNNLENRVLEHNRGEVKYTYSTRPFKLVFSQEYENVTTARKIEYKLKRFKNKKILERVIKEGKIKMKV